MSRYYKLVDKEVIPIDITDTRMSDCLKNNRILKTRLDDGRLVSTVFLSLDHNFGEGGPLVFETMVFCDSYSEEEVDRYSTYDEAVEGHWKMVRKYGGRRPHDVELDEELFKL